MIVPFEELQGKVLTNVEVDFPACITFYTSDGNIYDMYHEQDCCESVTIEDINGEWSDLIGYPLVLAEEVSNSGEGAKSGWDDSWTWTFYKLVTNKGYVNIRWYGASNGYYSESVSINRR